jgi:putative FmdB family regulatory protein
MPVYDYKCPTCDATTTVVRGISDQEAKPVCIGCATEMVRAYDSAPAVTFKGTGWGKD